MAIARRGQTDNFTYTIELGSGRLHFQRNHSHLRNNRNSETIALESVDIKRFFCLFFSLRMHVFTALCFDL